VIETDILQELTGLAEQAGLRVRTVRGPAAPDLDGVASSAVCRVKGETWVVLSASDPAGQRIAVLASALREHAADWLEGRYLPPALRGHLDPDST